MRRVVRTLAIVIPWAVHVALAGSWAIAGYAAGFPFFAVMAVIWTALLIVFRRVTTTEARRSKRALFDVIFAAFAFLAAWEGGITVLPALACFLVADLVDPTTPAFPVRVPRLLIGAAAIAAVLLVVPIALTAPLYTSVSSGPVGPGITPGPDVVTTTTLLDAAVADPTALVVLAALGMTIAVATVVLRRRQA